MEKRCVVARGETVTYELSIKRIRNYNMRIRENGEVYVSAPIGASLASIDKFVTDRVDFIHSARERLQSKPDRSPDFSNVSEGSVHYVLGEPMTLKITNGKRSSVTLDAPYIVMSISGQDTEAKRIRMLHRALCELLYSELVRITERVYPLFSGRGVPYPEIRIKNMRSRWGSCHTKKGLIAYSSELAGVQSELIEYVVMHEMCHFLYADHSEGFHRELGARMPDYKQRRRRLNGK